MLLVSNPKVAVLPGDTFGLPRYVQFSFVLGDDDLLEGINRLVAFVNG